MGYDFVVEYRSGRDNIVADGLSRSLPDLEEGVEKEEKPSLAAVSAPLPLWLDAIKEELGRNESAQEIIQKIQRGESKEGWKYKDGVVTYRDKIFLPKDSTLIPIIVEEMHTCAHEGREKTLKRIKAVFTWKGMQESVEKVIQGCEVCQKSKNDNQRPLGLLQPLPIPERIWEDISMDFVDPNSQGKSVILVVVDRLSKFGHFIPLSHPYTAYSVALAFFESVFKLYGMPRSIVCDRDPMFTSNFWRELFRMQNTCFKFSSSYHPQTDGQTESLNKTLEMYLRCLIGEYPKDWFKWLSWVQYSYNTSWHSSTLHTPYEIVYGREPPSLLSYVRGSTRVAAVEQLLEERDAVLGSIKQNLQAAQERMKRVYDQNKREGEFQEGEWVLVKFPQHKIKDKHQKLNPKFSGPFKIRRRIGAVAYELLLPESARIHPVFHISKLRRFKGKTPEEEEDRDEEYGDASETFEEEADQPQAVLEKRKKGRKQELLVHWKGKPPTEATWVEEAEFRERYPASQVLIRADL